ncbi:MAG: acetoacetate--CoA ligase [Proteobacteria bacterium]|nr:acetoacetate--CoA ligase [Pseudomonadota bacterium]
MSNVPDAPSPILWRPDQARIEGANMTRFIAAVNERWGEGLADSGALYRFSIDEMEKFWLSVREEFGLLAETWGERVLVDPDKMPGARWFPDARLNFAENLLRRRDDSDAIVFRGEDRVKRRLSWAELQAQVSVFARGLSDAGVGQGDRVAGYLPNMPEAVIAMLATASLGAAWSSASPDFGVRGVLDRFGQIEPKVLFAADGYFYNGRTYDTLPKLGEIAQALPSVSRVVVVPYTRDDPDIAGIPNAVMVRDFLGSHRPGDIDFVQVPFDQPLYILFTSGTTGVPKCIVHGVGGTLLQHTREHRLQCDIKPGDRMFHFTTLGWMMWNWLVSALASEATILLYDGSPFHPDGNALFDYADAEDMTLMGISARYLGALEKAGVHPAETHELTSLRTMTSTGSPLAPEGFKYVYDRIKTDIHLASITGGTDIIGCFAAGDATIPVRAGEIQARALGMAVDVFDDDGNPVAGEKGELVCTKPFPSLPVGFWNDPDGSRYHAAYFEKFENVWWHGDYVELTESGGLIVYGRSDATLNPGGVRIGTAEIYRQVEAMDEVTEAIVIGQDWEGDTRVVLFVLLAGGAALDGGLGDRIKARIRDNCSPHHVPAKIVPVADIPRTKSGKITELAVRDVVHGRPVKNMEALDNPEALELFRDLPELKT